MTEITGGDAARARKESDEEEFSENENRGAEFMFCPLKERVWSEGILRDGNKLGSNKTLTHLRTGLREQHRRGRY